MSPDQITSYQNQINSATDCAKLQQIKTDLLAALNTQEAQIQTQLEKLLELTDPATFIVNFIKNIQGTITQLQDELNSVTAAINTLSSTIGIKIQELGCNV